MQIDFILLQAGADSGSGAWISQAILFSSMLIVAYFFFIRPQQKKVKEQANFRNSIKKGDMVVTNGGLHGKIYSIEESTIVLEVDKGIKLTFEKAAISMEASKLLMDKEKPSLQTTK